jgi:hypothetical protein
VNALESPFGQGENAGASISRCSGSRAGCLPRRRLCRQPQGILGSRHLDIAATAGGNDGDDLAVGERAQAKNRPARHAGGPGYRNLVLVPVAGDPFAIGIEKFGIADLQRDFVGAERQFFELDRELGFSLFQRDSADRRIYAESRRADANRPIDARIFTTK